MKWLKKGHHLTNLYRFAPFFVSQLKLKSYIYFFLPGLRVKLGSMMRYFVNTQDLSLWVWYNLKFSLCNGFEFDSSLFQQVPGSFEKGLHHFITFRPDRCFRWPPPVTRFSQQVCFGSLNNLFFHRNPFRLIANAVWGQCVNSVLVCVIVILYL